MIGTGFDTKEFAGDYNPADVFYLSPKEGEKSIKVESTLEFLEKAQLAPIGKSKLFIINDASTMTVAAQNKMLKTLEENTSTNFLLIASNENTILPTIKSRCVTQHVGTHIVRPSNKIMEAAKKLLESKKLDDALEAIVVLTRNVPESLVALNLQCVGNYDILKTLAQINRNIMANCNPKNAFDLLIMRLYEKNSTN